MFKDLRKTEFPAELLNRDNWVCWRYAERMNKRTGEIEKKKVPYQTNGNKAKPNDRKTWTSYGKTFEALQASGTFDGIGYMFDGETFGVDIDHCVGEDGRLSDEAEAIVALCGSYTEYSPSGTGLHILCCGSLPGDKGRRKGPVEVYGCGRYFTVTGRPYGAPRPIKDASEAAAQIIRGFGTSSSDRPRRSRETASTGERSNDEVLRLIRYSEQAEQFEALWRGDTSGHGGDSSAADIALCNILAFWTGRSAGQMDELFRQSSLMRNKWDEMHGAETYGAMTIRKAIEDTQHVFGEQRELSFSDPDSPFRCFEDAYGRDGRYIVSEGKTYHVKIGKDGEPERRLLADFAVIPVEELTRDDGAELRQEFVLHGISASGHLFPSVHVPAAEFGGMSWVLKNWGLGANIQPGQQTKELLRHAIQSIAPKTSTRKTVYTHTGWKKINGKWAYLYHGGAVGAEGVTVELDGILSAYALPEVGGNLRASLDLLDYLPPRIAVPLLGHIFLAPLCEFMAQAGCAPMHTLFLAGTSGAKKSTISALALSHFGCTFSYDRLPANFHDTANTLRRKAFVTKDAPLLVDDLHPVSDPRERKRMDDTAQNMARAWGDRSERGRMRADLSLQTAQPPRGVGMMTGEDLPDIGESGLARFYLVEIQPEDVKVSDGLTDLQRRAANGEFSAAMRTYIEWLLPQADALPGKLRDHFEAMRGEVRNRLSGVHDRQPGAVAAILLGLGMLMRCAVERGEMTSTDADAWHERALEALLENARVQKETSGGETPVTLFFSTLFDLFSCGEVRILPADDDGGVPCAGYADGEYLYLNATAAFTAVYEGLRRSGKVFPISKSALWKRASEQGYLTRDATKRIGGRSPRFKWFPLDKLEDAGFDFSGVTDADNIL